MSSSEYDTLFGEPPSNLEITLTITIDKGTYWPQHIQDAVLSNVGDPWKDDASMLVAYLTEALSKVHGVMFHSATTAFTAPPMSYEDTEPPQERK